MSDDLIARLRPYNVQDLPCAERGILDRCGGHYEGFCYHEDPRDGVRISQRYVHQCPTCKPERWQTILSDPTPDPVNLTQSNVRERINWAEYFLTAADNARLRSTCPRGRCGTVLVDKHHRLISSGYSGRKRGEPHCDDIGCTVFANHDVLSIHSEWNACWQLWEVYCELRGWDPQEHDWTDFLVPLDVTPYVVAPLPICSGCARTFWTVGIRREPIFRQVDPD